MNAPTRRIAGTEELSWARESNASVGVRILPLDQLTDADRAKWHALSKADSSGSIFAEPWFLTAGLNNFDRQGDARLFVVEEPERWIGVIALHRSTNFGRMPAASWQNWSHPNQFLGTPLVRKGQEYAFWHHLLSALDSDAGQCFGLQCNDLPTDDSLFQALTDCCADDGRHMTFTRRFHRAVLNTDLDFQAYWSNALPPKHAARLRSLARKLEREQGSFEFTRLDNEAALPAWIDEFLALEHSGWKGRNRSSLQSNGDTQDFFKAVIGEGFAAGQLELVALRINGKAIAMSAHFFRDGHGYGFKMAYDEDYARYGPGLMLLQEITRVLDRDNIVFFDGCSAPGQQPISSMWHQRRSMVNCCISLKGWQQQMTYHLVFAARKLWHQSKLIPRPYF